MSRTFTMSRASTARGGCAFAATLVLSSLLCSIASAQSPPSVPAAQPTPAPPPTPTAQPTLDQRLARLCEDLEQRRADLKISGLSLAIVKDDRIVLARGFGLRDRETQLPCDETTLYGIGSTTKAFTSMLFAMLAEEGKLSFTERPSKYLPWFKFKDPTTDANATLRDLMAHRTGLTRTDMAWFRTGASRDDLLHNIAVTENNTGYKKAWQYNNAMFLCAGECEAAVTGKSWDELVATRIFAPLGMQRSGTTAAFARADPQLSKGYDWDDKKKEFVATKFMSVDNCGPAGSITSTVVDMAQWVRFLLNRGTYEGRRLVRAEAFDELWRDDDDLAPNYGQGWFIHPGDAELAARGAGVLFPMQDTQSWKDGEGRHHLVVEHSGNVPGFAAEVGLLPEFHLGLVMLSNVSGTQLQGGILDLVFDALLGPWRERRAVTEGKALAESATKPWLGAYSEGRIGLPPRVLQRGSDHLVLIFPAAPGQVTPAAFTLMWAGGDGRFWLREDPDAYVTIDRDDKGAVASLTLVRNGDARVMKPLPAPPPPEPPDVNVEEFMTARMAATGSAHGDALKNLRLTGTMSFPQSGIRGRYVMVAQGLEKLRIEYDAGKFGHSLVVIDGGRGFGEDHFNGYRVLSPAECATLQFANPLLEQGNWLDHSEECEVVGLVRASSLGLPISDQGGVFTEVKVKPADADPLVFYVQPATHLTAMVEGAVAFPGVPNTLPFARVSLVHPVGAGLKIPFKRMATEPQIGQLILEIEKAEVDVDLPADTFAIKPPPAADVKSGS